jgi:hypothetical protein
MTTSICGSIMLNYETIKLNLYSQKIDKQLNLASESQEGYETAVTSFF